MASTIITPSQGSRLESIQTKPEKVRIDFLDGLRGLASLGVVLFHSLRILNTNTGPADSNNLVDKFYYYLFFFLKYGSFGVVVFLVISGYSLMLPVARSLDESFPKGIPDFFKRRFRRILPPYYVALALSLLFLALVPGMTTFDTKDIYFAPNNSLPAFKPDVILSHIFLVQDFSPDWSFKINGVMWSIPIEFQIYFLFPFILLPVWRKLGSLVSIGVFLIIGLGLAYSFKPVLDYASPWYIALFVFGMAGASINFSKKPIDIFLRNRVSWGKTTLGLFVILVGVIAFGRQNDFIDFGPLRELIVGLVTLSGIVYLTEKTKEAQGGESKNIALRVLNNRWILLLGGFSYSLYLVHNPVQNFFARWSVTSGFSQALTLSIQLFIVVPLVILLAYIFHILIERRFMNSPRKN